MSNIGIMGGTFNPIHFGHLIAAEEVLSKLNLDKILFIPTGNPPHKDRADVIDASHRYEMVKLAIEDNDNFYISDIEVKRQGTSYTHDTLIELHKKDYGNTYHFIIGFDTLRDMDTWRNVEKVCGLCSFVVVNRSNLYEDMQREIEKKKLRYNADISIVDMPNIDISSTDIRRRLLSDKPVRYFVPLKVLVYIDKNKLYRGA